MGLEQELQQVLSTQNLSTPPVDTRLLHSKPFRDVTDTVLNTTRRLSDALRAYITQNSVTEPRRLGNEFTSIIKKEVSKHEKEFKRQLHEWHAARGDYLATAHQDLEHRLKNVKQSPVKTNRALNVRLYDHTPEISSSEQQTGPTKELAEREHIISYSLDQVANVLNPVDGINFQTLDQEVLPTPRALPQYHPDRFPTENQAHLFLDQIGAKTAKELQEKYGDTDLHSIVDQAANAFGDRYTKQEVLEKLRNGSIGVQTLNQTRLDLNGEHYAITSRCKRHKREGTKLAKALFGFRDDLPFDSIALRVEGPPEGLVDTYFHFKTASTNKFSAETWNNNQPDVEDTFVNNYLRNELQRVQGGSNSINPNTLMQLYIEGGNRVSETEEMAINRAKNNFAARHNRYVSGLKTRQQRFLEQELGGPDYGLSGRDILHGLKIKATLPMNKSDILLTQRGDEQRVHVPLEVQATTHQGAKLYEKGAAYNLDSEEAQQFEDISPGGHQWYTAQRSSGAIGSEAEPYFEPVLEWFTEEFWPSLDQQNIFRA